MTMHGPFFVPEEASIITDFISMILQSRVEISESLKKGAAARAVGVSVKPPRLINLSFHWRYVHYDRR